jgi:non-ribosomal peptide synthetase-like protein
VAVVFLPWEPIRTDIRLFPLLWAGIMSFACMYTLLAVLSKKLFIGNQAAGAHAYGSWQFRLNHFGGAVIGGWIRWVGTYIIGTEWYCMMLRRLGATIGKDCILSSYSSITNYDLTTLGDGVQMHFGAQLQGHTFEGKIMKVDRVVIGDGCQLAANAMVLQDTVLEKNVILHANTLILKGDYLNEGTEWRGNPPTLVQQKLILAGNIETRPGLATLEQMDQDEISEGREDDDPDSDFMV